MKETLHSVITTIQEPTRATRSLASQLNANGYGMIIVGDQKGPEIYDLGGVMFLSLQDQFESRFDIARKLPVNHYARKNIGYLHAIAQGASCIYETDDDNTPLVGLGARFKKKKNKKKKGKKKEGKN